MPGTKRAADDSPSTTSPRASKAQKTNKKSTKQPPLSVTEFKSKALPLHVNITHTPPKIAESDVVVGGSEAEPGDVVAVDVPEDIGFIGNLTLLPSSFTTGSYGWKGSKRITVELQGGGEDDKEKVQIMLSINATVIGSKPGGKTDRGKAKKSEEVQEDSASQSASEDDHK